MNISPSNFTVFQASAGSGKTFTLVKSYLLKIFENPNPYYFQQILAITFTNKACAEMKSRVLNYLKSFSEGNFDSMSDLIQKDLNLSDELFKKKAKLLYANILDHYAVLNISTIDSFTHKLIRSYAKELGWSYQFEVELDPTQIISEAIDALISKAGKEPELTHLMIEFVFYKMSENKSWNISHDLNKISSVLTHEEERLVFDSLNEITLDKYSATYKDLIRKLAKQTSEIREIGVKFLELLNDYSIEEDTYPRKTIPNFFKDLKKGNFSVESFQKTTISKGFENKMLHKKGASSEQKARAEQAFPEIAFLFNSAKEKVYDCLRIKMIVNELIPTALLGMINKEVEKIKTNSNIRFNADFNHVIHQQIKDQPVAYIFEKLGQRLKCFFIDEMQDTSHLQWENMKPLIGEAISQGNGGLMLVGDAKQSIYRWRGGNPEQFIALSDVENNNQEFSYLEKEVQHLKNNYRSCESIVSFNNDFFDFASQTLKNENIQKVYQKKNLTQLPVNKNVGYVQVDFLDTKTEIKEQVYYESVLNIVNDLSSKINKSAICVLVRTNKEGILLSNYLNERGIEVVSNETQLLSNSLVVLYLVSHLAFLNEPKDKEKLFELLKNHTLLFQLEDAHDFIDRAIKEGRSITELYREFFRAVGFEYRQFQHLALFDLVCALVKAFKLDVQNIYLTAFLDLVLDIQTKDGSDLNHFLDIWYQIKDKKSVSSALVPDAIQVMTIHKSKGLEFPVVIHFGNMNFVDLSKEKIWLSSNDSEIEKYRISFSEKNANVFDGGEEMKKSLSEAQLADSLNLLYVAFTRAVNHLYVLTEKLSEKNTTISTAYLLKNYLSDKTDDDFRFKIGDRSISLKQENTDRNISVVSPNYTLNNQLLTRLYLKQKDAALIAKDKRSYGIFFHQLLSEIKTTLDIPIVLDKYFKKGLITLDQKEIFNLKLNQLVNHPLLASFYKEEHISSVHNEREIINQMGEIIKPDRVQFLNDKTILIDYKTGVYQDSHRIQVELYRETLDFMGYKNIESYLVYFENQIIVKSV